MSKKFLDIKATIECRFTLKRVRDMITTYSYIERCFSDIVVNKKSYSVFPQLSLFWSVFLKNACEFSN